MRKVVPILIALIALTVAESAAQYRTDGFFLRPHINGTAWSIDSVADETESGGGIGVGVGYGFSDALAIFLEINGATIDPPTGADYTLSHVDLGAQFTVGARRSRIKGVFDLALTSRMAKLEFLGVDFEANGPGITAGAGIYYFFSRHLGLDVNLQATFGNIDEVSVAGNSSAADVDATSTRFNLGIVWFPGR